MKLVLRRFEYGSNYTVGRLYINDAIDPECFVLEDVVREPGVKVKGQTAIPDGKYVVTIDYSPHFKKDMPHILRVPMFTGIRIHSGNTDVDTEGCLLLGTYWPGGDLITHSRDAYNAFYPKLKAAIDNKETVTIEIVNTNR